MNKYSDEFKIKAVHMVVNGNAVKYVCRMLGIPDSRPLRDWLAHYNHGGIKQLLHKNRSYSPDFKQKVLDIPRILNKKSLSTAGSMGYH